LLQDARQRVNPFSPLPRLITGAVLLTVKTMMQQPQKPIQKPNYCPVRVTLFVPPDVGSLLPEYIDWTPLPEETAVRP